MRSWLIVLAAIGAFCLGVASLLLVQELGANTNRPPAQRATPMPREDALSAVPSSTPGRQRQIDQTHQQTKASPAPIRPAELGQPVVSSQAVAEVSWLDVNSAAGGIELTIRLRNRERQPLRFSFEPAKALDLSDRAGRSYDLRWAEYDGAPTIAPDADVQLVRAFFAAPAEEPAADQLTLRLKGVPGLPDARFDLRLPQPSGQPVAANQPVDGGGLRLTLAAAATEPARHSAEIAITVVNTGSEGITFSFFPPRDLILTDEAGRGYSLDWAAYRGEVALKPGEQAELVRAHFSGPLDQMKGKQLIVRVRNLPRVGGGAWSVPVQ